VFVPGGNGERDSRPGQMNIVDGELGERRVGI